MKYWWVVGCLLLALTAPVEAKRNKVVDPGPPIASVAEVAPFIEEMVLRHQFERDELQQLFREARLKRSILNAIATPAEAKPWYVYRDMFVESKRLAAGVRFWQEHEAALARAETQYGVPAEMISAIVGVETFYGRNAGSYRVIDALATLAFAYPKRAPFFRDQLEAYLLLAREQGFAPTAAMGSYAGAMGMPQFMPSSYREYAVDFDGDGRRDLWRDGDDVIGSVAYYFQRKGWRPGAPVVTRALVGPGNGVLLANKGWGYRLPLKIWANMGVTGETAAGADAAAMLLELTGDNGPEYWLAFENFYVITRYNNSFHYALAAYQLATQLREARQEQRRE
jgi:membrane-bound lytic murein transglycosylase B